MPSLPKPKTLWKYWDTVEKKIKEEIIWLQTNIDTFSNKERTAPTGCRECFMRRIAILIVSGQVKVKEITRTPFLSLGFKVVREPDVSGGRADLGVFKKGKPTLYIEVGTTSFFKLWLNLARKRIKNFTYLIVPNDDKLIEFTCS